MKSTLFKNTIREIRNSRGRFLSIALMISIGVFVFIGLNKAGPDMRNTMNVFSDKHNMSHLAIIFSGGITEKDKEKILSYDEISNSEFLQTTELTTLDNRFTINLVELPKKISKVEVMEGRLPEKEGEIIFDPYLKDEFSIGDTIEFNYETLTIREQLESINFNDIENLTKSKILKDKSKEELNLNTYTYNIVGFGYSPENIGPDRGISYQGLGSFDGIGYITKDNFTYYNEKNKIDSNNCGNSNNGDKYNSNIDNKAMTINKGSITDELEDKIVARIAYIRFKDMENLNYADSDFINRGNIHQEYLRKLFKTRQHQELADFKDKMYTKLLIPEDKITDGKEEILELEKQIEDASKELRKGWRKYFEGSFEVYNQINKALLKLDESVSRLNVGREEIAKAKSVLKISNDEYVLAKEKYSKGLDEYNENEKKIADSKQELNMLKASVPELQEMKEYVVKENALQPEIKQGTNIATKKIILEKERLKALQNGDIKKQEELTKEINNIDSSLKMMNFTENLLDLATISIYKYMIPEDTRKIYDRELKYTRSGMSSYIDSIIDSIPENENKIIKVEKELKDAARDLNILDRKLAKAEKELNLGQEKIKLEETKIVNGQRLLENSKKQLEVSEKRAKENLEPIRTELVETQKMLNKKVEEFKKTKKKALDDITELEKEIVKLKAKIERLALPIYTFQTRADNTYYYNYYHFATGVTILAYIFPPVLYLIAILVALTNMTRMVDEQRTQIGIFKALGYSNFNIIMKFVIYGALATVLGCVVALILFDILTETIYQTYAEYFIVGERIKIFMPIFIIVAILLAFCSTTLSAYLAVRKTLKENAAQLLRPKKQSGGEKVFLEKIKPLWKRFSFMQKSTFRNVVRSKVRTSMTIIGVAGCTALIFIGFNLNHALGKAKDVQKNVYKFDYIISYNKDLDEKAYEEFEELISREDITEMQTRLFLDTITTKVSDGHFENAMILVPKDDNFRKMFILLDERLNKEPQANEIEENNILEIGNSGIIMSNKLAKLTKKNKLDYLNILTQEAETQDFNISGIYRNYILHFVFLSEDYYKIKFGKNPDTNSVVIRLRDRVDKEIFEKKLSDNDAITNVLDIHNNEATETNAIDTIVIVILLISAFLAFVVIYNLTYVNISERLREISTIKVLGFYPEEVTKYIYSETILLTIIGIIVGSFFGTYLSAIINDSVVGSILFLPTVKPLWIYILSGSITMIFSLLIGILIHKRLQDVNMIEALQSYE